MGCPNHPEKAYINEGGRLVCPECTHVSPYQRMPSYADVVTQCNYYRKMLEDICECEGDLAFLIDKARKLLA